MTPSEADADLVRAAKAGNILGVRSALDAGADINACDGKGNTALTSAMNHTVIKFLLGVDGIMIDKRDWDGWTALMRASGIPDNESVSILVANGADISLKNKNGRDALHISISNGDVDSAATILNAGARIEPFHIFASRNEATGLLAGLLRAEQAKRHMELEASLPVSSPKPLAI